MISSLKNIHDSVFRGLEVVTESWFPGLFARLVFASVLLMFFLNSALTKVGSGFPDMFIPTSSAYVQILSSDAFQAYGFNVDNVPLFPETLIVFAGTYGEFVLPVLVVIGLFTRLSSLGMLIFIGVMTYVDIAFHNIDEKTIGHFFDRIQDSAISDQRLLWTVPLIYLVLKGPGLLSADALIGIFFKKKEISAND